MNTSLPKPGSLRRKANRTLLVTAVILALPLVAWFTEASEALLLASVTAAGMALPLGLMLWHRYRSGARVMATLAHEPLVTWTFTRTEWLAQMGREKRASHARRPRWIIPIVAALAAAALLPVLTRGSELDGRGGAVFLAIFAVLGIGMVGTGLYRSSVARRRAARSVVVVSASGALVGDHVIDWTHRGTLRTLAFDEAEHALRVGIEVRTRGGPVVVEHLVPVPRSERGAAVDLAQRLCRR